MTVCLLKTLIFGKETTLNESVLATTGRIHTDKIKFAQQIQHSCRDLTSVPQYLASLAQRMQQYMLGHPLIIGQAAHEPIGHRQQFANDLIQRHHRRRVCGSFAPLDRVHHRLQQRVIAGQTTQAQTLCGLG